MGKNKFFMNHPGGRRFLLVRERAAVSLAPLGWTPGCLIWWEWLLYLLPPIWKSVRFYSGVACDFLNGSVREPAWCLEELKNWLDLVHILGTVDMVVGNNSAKTWDSLAWQYWKIWWERQLQGTASKERMNMHA
jgi:hypothetical protein